MMEWTLCTVKDIFTQGKVPNTIIEDLSNNPCLLAYPSVVKMDNKNSVQEAKVGRYFEVSMIMSKVDSCSCCGFTQPYNVDQFYPNHLNAKYYEAWECKFLKVAKGNNCIVF